MGKQRNLVWRRVASLVLGGILLLACPLVLGACGKASDPKEPQPWQSNYELPETADALERLVEIYGAPEKLFLLQANQIYRWPCPTEQAGITLNFTCEVGTNARLVVDDALAEFNDVFAVINPHYYFKANYAPTDSEVADPAAIKVSSVAVFAKDKTLGDAPHSYSGATIKNGQIRIKQAVLNNGSELMHVVKHELMHLLGAGDAYNNEQATKDTIMQSYTVGGDHVFSTSDVAFLDALYRNPETPYSDQEIADYIAGYSTNNRHTAQYLKSLVYGTVLQNTDRTKLVAEIDALPYTVGIKAKIRKILNNDQITWNKEFGTTELRFGEMKYDEPDADSNYRFYHFSLFGSPEFDICYYRKYQNVTSNAILYVTELPNGLVLCSLNGNANYKLMCLIDDYVFAFYLSGDFDDLANLAVGFDHKFARYNWPDHTGVYQVTNLPASEYFKELGL